MADDITKCAMPSTDNELQLQHLTIRNLRLSVEQEMEHEQIQYEKLMYIYNNYFANNLLQDIFSRICFLTNVLIPYLSLFFTRMSE